MPAGEEQNVYITGHALRDWSTEATLSQVNANLKQIMADNNAMLRYTAAIATGDKNHTKILHDAVNAIQTETNIVNKGQKQTQRKDTELVRGQAKLTSSSLATVSALTGIGSTMLDIERREKKRQDVYNALILANHDEASANRGADAAMRKDLWTRIGTTMTGLMAGIKGTVDAATGAVEQGFTERFAMVAEMRQAGLLSALDDTEAGFIEFAKTISNTNFTFGEASEFTKRFAKAVGVNGVESALKFANTVASDDVAHGMGYMQRYALEFGQVSNIAGEYLDTLRIGGQLRGMDDRSMRAGMEDWMSNVEMTANVLKISMEDAADLMKKAFGPAEVALLASLPDEQRKVIDEAFLAMGAQGNPMGETLAKRLLAGSRGAFLQTAEYQEMAGTAPGREILNFVEQMALQLENNGTDSFQSAMAQGFPELADRLVEMMKPGGGVRIQILNDNQLASVVGQIIEAAQTYGEADKGTEMGAKREGETAMMANLIQLREAAVLNETAMNIHMTRFTEILEALVKVHRDIARSAALMLEDYTGTIHAANTVSKWWEEAKGWGLTGLMDFLTSEDKSKHPADGVLGVLKIQGQPVYDQEAGISSQQLFTGNKNIDNELARITEKWKEIAANEEMSDDDKRAYYTSMASEVAELGYQIGEYAAAAREAKLLNKDEMTIWKDNFNQMSAATAALKKLIDNLNQ